MREPLSAETGSRESTELAQRQPQDKSSSLARDTLDLDLSLVLSQNSLANRQAKPGSLSFRRKEGNEELGDVLSRDSYALILDKELKPRR